jgi:hypothetical protein
MDLAAQADRVNATVRLLINDNSVQPSERHTNWQLIEALRVRGVLVEIETAPRPGASIAASRRRQQEQLRDRLARHPRPTFVWMLDDDVRLDHIHWTGEFLDEHPLHSHLAFLFEIAHRQPALDVLIGEVCGDAPIPVIGSITSRLSDLSASLRAMFAARPDHAWCPPATAVEGLDERDAYYDLSVDRQAPAWEREIVWLPRGGRLTTAEALAQMLVEVEHIPRGAAFSRPILARPAHFADLFDRPLRGANAIFFDVDQCVRHEYPSVIIAGIETRRSDMIGTRLLAAAGATVRGSGFSVLHRRSRGAPWPTSEVLIASLVADTLGAWLVRQLDPGVGDGGRPPFVVARLERLQQAATTLGNVARQLRRLVREAPRWTPPLDPVLAVADWALENFPGARSGALPRDTVEIVLSTTARDDVVAAARRMAGGKAA